MLVVVKINITANEVIFLFDAWLIEPHQRVVLRFHLERAVEALHGVVDVAIGRNKSSCRASPLGTHQSTAVAAIFGVMPTLVFVELPISWWSCP